MKQLKALIFPSLIVMLIALSSNMNILNSGELYLKASLSGTVSDTELRLPLGKVKIEILETGQIFYTDSLGHFSIGNLNEGKFTFSISKEGFLNKQLKEVFIQSGMMNTLNILLEKDLSYVSPETPIALDDNIEVEPALYEESESYHKVSKMFASPGMSAGRNAGTYSIYDGYSETAFNTEDYDRIYENIYKNPLAEPLSTFSIDVDNASYSNMRRFLTMGQMPPKDAVRIEELVNYFDYDYQQPAEGLPFSMYTELSDCPWNPKARLLHIGLQGKTLDYEELDPSNIVFLIDVSGSMQSATKLPLVKKSLSMLIDRLNENDRVAIVVYAGAAGLVLASTPGSNKSTIKAALNNLKAGGSTAGGAGIKLAYKVAKNNLIDHGNNRVVLVTDGDFNVGASSDAEMIRLIEEQRNSGIYLTVCGFGMGNYKDSKMEKIADKGNGNYFYIDNEKEAKKVFVTDMRATLFTIAKDVKLQLEFNPAYVAEYRLVGYENRVLNNQDFDNDKKDAGELGAGHTVTALYEIIPTAFALNHGQSDLKTGNQHDAFGNLKYQNNKLSAQALDSGELMTLKLRYKKPDEDKSRLLILPVLNNYVKLQYSSENFRWSAAVAEFGLLLRDSEFKATSNYAQVLELAQNAKGADLNAYRAEFIQMVQSCLNIVASK